MSEPLFIALKIQRSIMYSNKNIPNGWVPSRIIPSMEFSKCFTLGKYQCRHIINQIMWIAKICTRGWSLKRPTNKCIHCQRSSQPSGVNYTIYKHLNLERCTTKFYGLSYLKAVKIEEGTNPIHTVTICFQPMNRQRIKRDNNYFLVEWTPKNCLDMREPVF